MKNNILKLAIIATFLTNIASIGAMGPFSTQMSNKIAKLAITKSKPLFPKFTRKDIYELNQETKEKTSRFVAHLTGKGYVEKMVESLQDKAKKGINPSSDDLKNLDRYSMWNNYGVLNLASEAGHTLWYHVLHNNPSKALVRQFNSRGAELNIRDKYVMEPDKLLKAYLNLPLHASIDTTLKVMRTFFTKNTPEKIQRKISSQILSHKDAEKRLKKIEDIKEIFYRLDREL